MSLKISVVFILLSLVRCYSNATQLDRILTHPDKVMYRDEGSNVSFEWNFHIGSWPNPRTKVIEFLFGEWAFPGYVRKKILYVQGRNQVKKRRGFEKKVDWRGNIYKCVNCKAVVVMYNLTRADFKSYGVYIELGVDRSPLTNWLRLVKTATHLDRILSHPDEVAYRNETSNVSFEWNFHIGSWPNPRPKAIEFIFGEWTFPGFVRKKILYVQGRNQVKKRPGFEKKVEWRGNIYKCVNCKAAVVMYNLTRADFKSYGVNIELGVDRSPLTNWLRLVKTEPASITKWTQNLEVYGGNSATIECRASGLPPPSVRIQRQNQTLRTCNDMKPCVYKIQAAKSEDQGEYVCLVQQGNSSVIISRPLNLTVLNKGKSKRIVADHERKLLSSLPFFCPYSCRNRSSNVAGSSLTGYINEELDIPCIFQRQKDMDVELYLCNPKKLRKFVSSIWNKTIQNYTKVCIFGHQRFEICDSWTMSYVHGNQTHFVVRNTPWELNWCKTQCVYEGSSEFGAHRDKVQVIRLKARGNVNGTLQLKLSIPKGHIRITFKINMIPVLRVEISNGSLNGLHCVKMDPRHVHQIVRESFNHHGVPGYDVCRDHMASSYVIASFVVFIFKNTPAYLNNSKLYYSINFVAEEKLWNDTIHPDETVLLLNKDTKTTTTTTYPPLNGNTTSNETVTNATFYPPNGSPKKNGLSIKERIGIIISIIGCILVLIAIGVIVCWWRTQPLSEELPLPEELPLQEQPPQPQEQPPQPPAELLQLLQQIASEAAAAAAARNAANGRR